MDRDGELSKKDEMQQKMESAITLEVKFKSNVPGIIEERADHGNVDTDTLQEPPNM